MLKSVLLHGAGGHAIACAEVIESSSCYDIVGAVVPSAKEVAQFPYKVYVAHSDEFLNLSFESAFVAIGQLYSHHKRKMIFDEITKAGTELPTFISKAAYVAKGANIGRGTIVMPGAVIRSGVSIGNNCIINSNSLIEHGCQIGDHCHIATGALVNGNVQIEEGCFFGSGSIVIQDSVITAETAIKAGQVISRRG